MPHVAPLSSCPHVLHKFLGLLAWEVANAWTDIWARQSSTKRWKCLLPWLQLLRNTDDTIKNLLTVLKEVEPSIFHHMLLQICQHQLLPTLSRLECNQPSSHPLFAFGTSLLTHEVLLDGHYDQTTGQTRLQIDPFPCCVCFHPSHWNHQPIVQPCSVVPLHLRITLHRPLMGNSRRKNSLFGLRIGPPKFYFTMSSFT